MHVIAALGYGIVKPGKLPNIHYPSFLLSDDTARRCIISTASGLYDISEMT
jgi:hypothetical protein